MRTKKVLWIFVSFILFHTSALSAQQRIPTDSLLQLVKEAYIYGFPAEQVFRMYVTLPDNIGQAHRNFNHFSYAGKIASAAPDNSGKVAAYKKTRNRGGAGPNTDTPYFGSLLDLSYGPLVLNVPDFGSRYFSFHFIDFANRNIHYIGSSFGDTVAARYLLIGPDWKGTIPKGLIAVRLPVNRLNLFGRTLVEDDSADLRKVLEIQHRSSLTALDRWPESEGKDTGIQIKGLPEYYEPIDSFFTNLNHSLQLSPAPAEDKAILRRLAVLGVGTGKSFDWNKYDEATRQRIHAALLATDSALDANGGSGDRDFGNGWQRTNPLIGHWGTHYLERAEYMKHGFYAGHDEKECFYIVPVSKEGHGYFKGDHKYRLHFEKNGLPPVGAKGFWSATANEIPGYFLLPNPIHRYAIRDRTKGLTFNADGSLDLYIQAEAPEESRKSNWLPIAATESTITVRVYLPEKPLFDGSYKLPAIETVE